MSPPVVGCSPNEPEGSWERTGGFGGHPVNGAGFVVVAAGRWLSPWTQPRQDDMMHEESVQAGRSQVSVQGQEQQGVIAPRVKKVIDI